MECLVTPQEIEKAVLRWEDWRRALYVERAAIMQFHGNLPKNEAERLAFEAYKPQAKQTQGRFDL